MGTGASGWSVMLITEFRNEWGYTSAPPVCIHGIDINSFVSFTLGPLLKIFIPET